MDETQFQDLVDRLGEHLALWPEEARTEAEALLSASAPAREILRQATALRAALAAHPPIKAPAGLAARIIARSLEAEDATDEPGARLRRG